MYRLLQEFIKIDEQKKWAASENNDPAYMMALVAQDRAVNMSKELLARKMYHLLEKIASETKV